MKSVHLLRTLAVAGLLFAPLTLPATVLLPGDHMIAADPTLTVGTNIPAAIGTNATLKASTTVLTSTGGSVTASYLENVYLDPTHTAICPLGGCLDFVIAAKDIGGSILEHITTASFAGTSVNVGYETLQPGCVAGFGVPECIIDSFGALSMTPFTPSAGGMERPPVTMDLSGDGSVVTWDFVPGFLKIGDTTPLLVIQTNATSFDGGTLGFLDGTGASGTGFAPTPEPRLISFAAMGLLGLVAFFARRRKVQVAE